MTTSSALSIEIFTKKVVDGRIHPPGAGAAAKTDILLKVSAICCRY